MKIWESLKKKDLTDITFLMIALISIVLRIILFTENRGLWSDEASVAIHLPKMSFLDLILPDEHYIFGGPSFFYLVTKLIILLFGSSELSLRLFPLICSVLIFFVIWEIKKKLTLKTSSLVMVALVGLSPDLIYFSQEAKAYSLDPLMVSWVLLLLVKSSNLMNDKIKSIYFLTSLSIIWISLAASIAWLALLCTLLLYYADHRKLFLQFITLNSLSILIFWLCFTKGSYHDLYALQYHHWAGPLYDSFSPTTDILKIFKWWLNHLDFAVTKLLDFDFRFSIFAYLTLLSIAILRSRKAIPPLIIFVSLFVFGIISANLLKLYPLSLPSDEMWNVRLWQGFIPIGFILITCFSFRDVKPFVKFTSTLITVVCFLFLLPQRFREAKSEAILVSGYPICFQQMALEQDNFDLVLFQDNFLFEYYSERFPIKKKALLFRFSHSHSIDKIQLPSKFITVEYQKMIDSLGDKTINGRKFRPRKKMACQEYAYYVYEAIN